MEIIKLHFSVFCLLFSVLLPACSSSAVLAPYTHHGDSARYTARPPYHTVQRGETLFSISKRYGTDVNTLVRINRLPAPQLIYTGQRIRLMETARPQVATHRVLQTPVRHPGAAPRPQPKPVITAQAPIPQEKPINVSAAHLSLPGRFVAPTQGRIIGTFGPKPGGLHNDGININAPLGAPVVAAEEGVVIYIGNALERYGNLVLIKHGGEFTTAYAHLGEVHVTKGTRLRRGQQIGTVGQTGAVTRPQLHFEIRKDNEPLNPQGYL